MGYNEVKDMMRYNATKQKEAELRKSIEEHQAMLESVDKNSYYETMNNRVNPVKSYNRFKQEVSDALVTEAVYCLSASCVDSLILENQYNKNLLRALVSNFVAENGSQNLIRKWRGTSYLMSEMSYILDQNINAICEKADPKNQASLKIKEDDKKKFFKDLDKTNADSAVSAIRTKVKNATAEFIDSNNKAKEQIKSILSSTKKKIEKDDGKDENLKEAYAALGKRKITDIRNNRTRSVFEEMVRAISTSAMKGDPATSIFIEDAQLNMDKIVEHCEVMYTFLETLNTCKLAKIDEQYIENMIKELEG